MKRSSLVATCILSLAATSALAQDNAPAAQPSSPSQGYEVHDMSRPYPPKVEPGRPSTQDQVGSAPSDAIVLFDGHDLSKWQSVKGGDAPWKVEDGILTVAPHSGAILTKDSFGDCQLHVEWKSPTDSHASGQGRSNSGVFLMNLYEVQVLDTAENKTYADGMAGALYGQFPPLVNPALPAGNWQTYDIIFHRPHFDSDGKLIQAATFTIVFNGVLVQDDTHSIGPTQHMLLASYPKDHPDKAPLQLQDHGNPVMYRNIWLRPLPERSEYPKPPVRPNHSEH